MELSRLLLRVWGSIQSSLCPDGSLCSVSGRGRGLGFRVLVLSFVNLQPNRDLEMVLGLSSNNMCFNSLVF